MLFTCTADELGLTMATEFVSATGEKLTTGVGALSTDRSESRELMASDWFSAVTSIVSNSRSISSSISVTLTVVG